MMTQGEGHRFSQPPTVPQALHRGRDDIRVDLDPWPMPPKVTDGAPGVAVCLGMHQGTDAPVHAEHYTHTAWGR